MKIKILLFVLFLPFLLISCASDEFELDELEPASAVSMGINTDLDAVLGAFYQNPEGISTFQQELVVEAYVVSSDEAGNFYKELVVQDKPENPLAGVTIKLNMNSYFQFYNFGRKVFISLKGLSIGNVNGVPALGIANGKQIENIPQSRISAHLTRSSEVAEIIPLKVEAAQFNDRWENIFVRLENVQFSKLLVNPANPFTFAGEDNDEYDGERLVESCVGDFPFVLSTSTYADFGKFRLPTGSGSLQGVLTRDFYDDFYTIYLNSPADLDFGDGNRCDPAFVDCGLAEKLGEKILFSEDFTTQKNNKPVIGNGWSNFVQEGSRPWEAYTATGGNASLGRSARMRPSGSGDQRSVSWLITPRINFDTNQGEVLQFKTSTSFANGSLLEVLISTDWDGKDENVLSATWEILSAAYIAQNNDFFGDWISSGNVDLSCINGKGYIAFKYTGSDLAYYNGIYELDDIFITAD